MLPSKLSEPLSLQLPAGSADDPPAAGAAARRLAVRAGLPAAEQIRLQAAVSDLASALLAGRIAGGIELTLRHEPPAVVLSAVSAEPPPRSAGLAETLFGSAEVEADAAGRRLRLIRRIVPAPAQTRDFSGFAGPAGSDVVALLLELDRQAEQSQRAADLLRERDGDRIRLLNSVAHEVRNPLNTIGLLLAYLRRKLADSDPEIGELMDELTDASGALNGLLTDLLDYSRLAGGREQVRPERFSPVAVFEQAIAPHRRAAEKRGVSVTLEADPELSEVVGDRAKCARVAGILVSHVAERTGSSYSVRMRLSSAEGGRRWSACVAAVPSQTHVPAAAGAPAAGQRQEQAGQELPALFEPMPPAGAPRTRAGSSLGLAVAERLMVLMRGRLSVDSAPGRPVTLTADWPADARTAVPIEEQGEPMPAMRPQ